MRPHVPGITGGLAIAQLGVIVLAVIDIRAIPRVVARRAAVSEATECLLFGAGADRQRACPACRVPSRDSMFTTPFIALAPHTEPAGPLITSMRSRS